MGNRIVYINTWSMFEEGYLAEWAEIKPTGTMDYVAFINQKRKEIGLISMKYMEYEVFDERKFMLAVIKYGIKTYNLDEVACGINA